MTRSLKAIKNRIRSITNTKKVTSALEMISVSKLNRTDVILYPLRAYGSRLESCLDGLVHAASGFSSPFFLKKEGDGTLAICLITSDSGLCAGYNNNIIRAAEKFIRERGREKIGLIAVGKKGLNHFKRQGVRVLEAFTDLHGRYSQATAEKLAFTLTDIFITRKVSEVYVAFTKYQSAFTHTPMINKFLNLDTGTAEGIPYLLEPDKERIQEELLPKYILTKVKLLLLEAFTSEHAARTLAMKAATENASELLDKLLLQRNKVRQANITQDIMEVVSSSEALRG